MAKVNQVNNVNNVSKANKAEKHFINGLSCSQSILLTYGVNYGLNPELAIRLGTGFSGGLARHGEVCGAISGGIAVIGLKYGMAELGDNTAKARTYELVAEFIKKFKAKHNSILCRELLGCDISTSEGRKLATDENRFKTLCPKFVHSAAKALESVLQKK